MRPENLLSSLVAIYPPEGSSVERAGYLAGERAPTGEVSPRMVRAPLGLLGPCGPIAIVKKECSLPRFKLLAMLVTLL